MELDLDGGTVSILATTYITTFLAVALIFVRLIWRYRRGERMYADDMWMGISLCPLLIRLGLIHIVLVYGTNNFDYNEVNISEMSQGQIERRVIGSKLTLLSRVVYAGFLWCMKVCILGFYERLTARAKPYNYLIDLSYLAFLVTFIGVIFSTLLECRPFPVYWQISPNPGGCVMGVAQLLTMGAFNISTDAMLILIPLPLVFGSRLPLVRKIQLLALFCLGLFVVSITIIRMPVIIGDNSTQRARTLWASIECFAACIVANAPVLNTFIQKVRKYPSENDQYHLSPHSRRRRMPVTGQDSRGSLTRNDELISVIETRTDVVQKIDIDFDEPMGRTGLGKSPWRGDFLGTHIWTESDQQLLTFPARPPPVLAGVINTKRSGSV